MEAIAYLGFAAIVVAGVIFIIRRRRKGSGSIARGGDTTKTK